MEDVNDQEKNLRKDKTGFDENSLCGAIEAVLFMSERPISLKRIKKVIGEDISLRIFYEAIERLQRDYEASYHGISLEEVAEGYQFRTKAVYSKFVKDLFKSNTLMLSSSVLEVLAVIAYKQPVSKMEIERIRGVDSSHIVRGLIEKRLVKVVGKSKEIGRSILYGTTKEFLETFNLASLAHLPPKDELEDMVDHNVGEISDIKELVSTELREESSYDDIEEVDLLEKAIKAVPSGTNFTKEIHRLTKKSEDTKDSQNIFDVLDEHVEKKRIKDANADAATSEVFTKIFSPTVVGDILKSPFRNAPGKETASLGIEAIFCVDKDGEQKREISNILDKALNKVTEERVL